MPEPGAAYLNRSETLRRLIAAEFRVLAGGARTGYLAVGEHNVQDTYYDLVRDYAYAFLGACDEDCRDMDIQVYDPAGNKVTEDLRADDSPEVRLLAAQSGRYTVRTRIPKCHAPFGCYWAVQAAFK